MNKNILLASVLIFSLFSCGNKNEKTEQDITSGIIKNPITADGNFNMKNMPIIKFENEEHDFGILLQGEKVSHTFKFKNIGKQDLIVKDASASCGCTVPKFSQKPIAPGEEGEIEVIFDSNRRSGRQVKSITVWTNCQPNQNKLRIISEIVEPK
ncbi:MAG: DUF1573 domain-containing protein [Salinivirgaceae bacterium]|nr:DUF1573 domain-containing protein [Salinivirgaceae bacterium]